VKALLNILLNSFPWWKLPSVKRLMRENIRLLFGRRYGFDKLTTSGFVEGFFAMAV
jgi:hypothetical protein